MIAFVKYDVHSDLAWYRVTVLKALSLERMPAFVMLVVNHLETSMVPVRRRTRQLAVVDVARHFFATGDVAETCRFLYD